jgi:hypothetical protein
MSTTTLPNLAFSSDAATGFLPAASTMPIGALAWSAEEPSDHLNVGTPVNPARTPRSIRARSTRARAGLAAGLLVAIGVGAALGVAVLDRSGSAPTPSTAVVVDRTDSAPAVPSAAATVPAPTPSITEAVVPAGAARVTTQAVAPPKVVVSTPQPAAPPGSAPDTSIIVGGGYPGYNGDDPAKPTEHHDWDHQDQDHHHQDHHDDHKH